MTRERRRYPRVRGPFDGTWNGAPRGRSIRIVDLSRGGCFVDDVSRPAVNERVHVTVHLPGGGQLEADGHVLYVDRVQGFAVKFNDDIDDATAKRLRAAIPQFGS